MPTYEYECDGCNHGFEMLQSMIDKKLTKCPECGQETLHRLIGSGSGIIFKGTGFYETDYKKKETSQTGSTNTTGAAAESKVSDTPKVKAESKPESKG